MVEKFTIKDKVTIGPLISRRKRKNRILKNERYKFIELAGEFVEPIQLQLIGQRLWKKLLSEKILNISLHNLGDLVDVDKALVEFYEGAIHETSKDTGIYEGDIRIWFETNLITPSGTRSIVHRGETLTHQMPTKVVDYLEKKRILREDWRSGAKWYELTHDRLIKPIQESNDVWKNNLQNELKIKKNKHIIKFGSGVISIVIFILLFSQYVYPHFISSETVGIISIKNMPYDISIDPESHRLFIANTNDSVTIIDSSRNKVIGLVNMPHGSNPVAIAVDSPTHMVYVANFNDGSISVINGTSQRVVGDKPIPVGTNPVAIAVDSPTHTGHR